MLVAYKKPVVFLSPCELLQKNRKETLQKIEKCQIFIVIGRIVCSFFSVRCRTLKFAVRRDSYVLRFRYLWSFITAETRDKLMSCIRQFPIFKISGGLSRASLKRMPLWNERSLSRILPLSSIYSTQNGDLKNDRLNADVAGAVHQWHCGPLTLSQSWH